MRTHIVLSTQYYGRPVERPNPERMVTASARWN